MMKTIGSEFYRFGMTVIGIEYDHDDDCRWSTKTVYTPDMLDPATGIPLPDAKGKLIDMSPYDHDPVNAAMMLDIGNPSRKLRNSVGPMSAESIEREWLARFPGRSKPKVNPI